MPALTILFGLALMVVGIGTYAASEAKPSALLLPIIFGLIALGLGVGSLIKKDLKMHLMHGAVLMAALGVLIPIIQLIMRVIDLWQKERDQALTLMAVLLTVVFSGAYVYSAVQSFRAARRTRKDGTVDARESAPKPIDTTPTP